MPQNSNPSLQELRAFLESAHLDVKLSDNVHEQELLIHYDSQVTLSLRLHPNPEQADQFFVQFLIPLGVEIPDPYFIQASQVIAEFNHTAPMGVFSISETSHPYFDYHFQVPVHGECQLNLLAAIRMSSLFAGRLCDYLQAKIQEWLKMSSGGLQPQIA